MFIKVYYQIREKYFRAELSTLTVMMEVGVSGGLYLTQQNPLDSKGEWAADLGLRDLRL